MMLMVAGDAIAFLVKYVVWYKEPRQFQQTTPFFFLWRYLWLWQWTFNVYTSICNGIVCDCQCNVHPRSQCLQAYITKKSKFPFSNFIRTNNLILCRSSFSFIYVMNLITMLIIYTPTKNFLAENKTTK